MQDTWERGSDREEKKRISYEEQIYIPKRAQGSSTLIAIEQTFNSNCFLHLVVCSSSRRDSCPCSFAQEKVFCKYLIVNTTSSQKVPESRKTFMGC